MTPRHQAAASLARAAALPARACATLNWDSRRRDLRAQRLVAHTHRDDDNGIATKLGRIGTTRSPISTLKVSVP
ncbi:MAG: hypothetical protein ACJ796_03190 [Gemmatimonadaceae bacterium]